MAKNSVDPVSDVPFSVYQTPYLETSPTSVSEIIDPSDVVEVPNEDMPVVEDLATEGDEPW